jgi:hypothetical protein
MITIAADNVLTIQFLTESCPSDQGFLPSCFKAEVNCPRRIGSSMYLYENAAKRTLDVTCIKASFQLYPFVFTAGLDSTITG